MFCGSHLEEYVGNAGDQGELRGLVGTAQFHSFRVLKTINRSASGKQRCQCFASNGTRFLPCKLVTGCSGPLVMRQGSMYLSMLGGMQDLYGGWTLPKLGESMP